MSDHVNNLAPEYVWPSESQTPYWVYTDQEIFDREMELIFRGDTWLYLCLEAEIPNPKDFVTCWAGTTPLVVSRNEAGEVYSFVNRCMHRGMKVVSEERGCRARHTCPYHNWTYDSQGDLIAVALEGGINGCGGMPKTFDKSKHGMRQLRVRVLHGVVFGTFSDNVPELEEYLGEVVVERIKKTVARGPLEIHGYHRHTLRANWKLFTENSKDAYHAPMLHPFLMAFGYMSPGDPGKTQISGAGFHGVIGVWNQAGEGSHGKSSGRGKLKALEDPSFLTGFKEHEDGLSLNIISMFPSGLFTCVGNTLSIRQIRPKAPGVVELYYTHFGFTNDTDEERMVRTRQSNLFGPAGYVAMEDVVALEEVQNAIGRGEHRNAALVEMGGTTAESADHLVTEGIIRGFWKGYREIMGIPMAQSTQASEV